jgi:hypothetical protein
VRSDLDRLMQQRGLAGLVVLALDRYSPAFYYATGQKIHHGFYVRTADGRAHLARGLRDVVVRAARLPAEGEVRGLAGQGARRADE